MNRDTSFGLDIERPETANAVPLGLGSSAGAGLFDVHRVIAAEGLRAARERSVTKRERAAVQAAAAVLAQRQRLPACAADPDDVLYAGDVVTGLPHKRIDAAAGAVVWEHDCNRARLRYEGGHPDGAAGVPYGAKARLLCLYLQTEALRRDSPEVELGPTLYAWLKAMTQQSIGGMTYKILREQAHRVFSCRLTVEWKWGGGCVEGPLVERLLPGEAAGAAGTVAAAEAFPARAVLGDVFFRTIQQSHVAIRRSAVCRIGHNGTAIDQYIALAQRLPLIDEATLVPWSDLAARFGTSYKRFRQMRPRYIDALRLALAVYPEARVDVTESGLLLHPSRAPV